MKSKLRLHNKLLSPLKGDCYLMRTELGVIKVFQGIFHVFITRVFHNTSSILENVSKLNITSISHMVLEILPATSGRQPRD